MPSIGDCRTNATSFPVNRGCTGAKEAGRATDNHDILSAVIGETARDREQFKSLSRV